MNYMVFKASLVVNFDGKNYTVAEGDERYPQILAAIRQKDFEEVKRLVDLWNDPSGELKLVDGVVHIKGVALPDELSERVKAFRTKGLPYDILLKFNENLQKNPSFNSRRMLFKFLENNGHPLTEDGCFIAYRSVTEDFKDHHTRTFNNTVGTVVSVPRETVDDNPKNLCSSGLHVAAFSYASTFGSNRKLVEVKVNPANVVCVPDDYEGTKMRVCEFEVVAECDAPRTEDVYPTEQDDNYDDSDDANDFDDDGYDTEKYPDNYNDTDECPF